MANRSNGGFELIRLEYVKEHCSYRFDDAEHEEEDQTYVTNENKELVSFSSPVRISMDHWVDLPQDVVRIIVRKLNKPIDIISFSAICKPWRPISMEYIYRHPTKIPIFHSLPKCCPLPMLLVPFGDGPEMHHLYSMNERKTYNWIHIPELKNKWICGSSNGWLVTVDKIDNEMHLLNLLERTQILLPHMSTFRAPLDPQYHGEINDCCYVRKANVFFRASRKVEDWVIVAIISGLWRICFCKIGDDRWTDVNRSPVSICDFLLCNDTLCYLDYMGALLFVNIGKQEECRVIAGRPKVPNSQRYLVKSPFGLLLVVNSSERHERYNATIGFRVFRLIKGGLEGLRWYKLESGHVINWNKGTHDWTEIESIGCLSIFVGYNYSLCVDSRSYPSCKSNCIYFADHDFDSDIVRFRLGHKNYTRHDIGVYHLKEKRVAYLTGLNNLSHHHGVWVSPTCDTLV